MTILLVDYDQLKPCPLCGAQVRGYYDEQRGWFPECRCGLTSHHSLHFESPIDMINWWNNRKEEDVLKVGHAAYCENAEWRIAKLITQRDELAYQLAQAEDELEDINTRLAVASKLRETWAKIAAYLADDDVNVMVGIEDITLLSRHFENYGIIEKL